MLITSLITSISLAEPTINTESTPVLVSTDNKGESVEATPAKTENINLKLELEKLKTSSAASEKGLQTLIKGAETIFNDQLSDEERVKGIDTLKSLNSPKVLRFYRAAVLYAPTAIKSAAINATKDHIKDPETLSIAQMCLSQSTFPIDVQRQCVNVLKSQGSDAAAQTLYESVSNKLLKREIRDASLKALESQFTEWLAKKGPPVAVSSNYGRILTAGAVGAAGSSILMGIGELGVSDSAVGIGAVSGFFIGAGSGVLYTNANPVSIGQGAMAASVVGWGLFQTGLLKASLGYNSDEAGWLRTLGGAGALYYASQRIKNDMELVDVIELNVAGYLGSSMTFNAAKLFESPEDYYDEYEVDEAEYRARIKRENVYLLAGSALGLAGGHLLSDKWKLNFKSTLFSGVAAIEGSVLGYMISDAFELDNDEEIASLTSHGAIIAGQLFNHWNPIDHDQTLAMAYTAATGHILGMGIPQLLGIGDDFKTTLLTSAALGLSGAIAGPHIAKRHKLNVNDAALIGIGTGFSMWNGWALAAILEDAPFLNTNDKQNGFGSTLQGLGQVASLSLATNLDIDKSQSLFVGSMGVWGAYYGFTAPYALGFSDSLGDKERLGLALALSDAAMLGAGYAVSSNGFMKAEDGAVPQLMGIGGAALGALGAYMATTDEQVVSLASMGGSLIGIGAGLYFNQSFSKQLKASKFSIDGFDTMGWNGYIGPAMMPDGSTGVSLQISKFGF